MATLLTSDVNQNNSRERIVEHVFVGDALRRLWQRGVFDVEVLRSEFDAHGYYRVLARGLVVRHIQFKISTSQRPGDVSVSRALSNMPSGCVVWIGLGEGLKLKSFFWFGGLPGEALPPIAESSNRFRVTLNKLAERPPRKNHLLVPRTKFRALASLDEVLEVLFGHLPDGGLMS